MVAGTAGFVTSYVVAGMLQWPRPWFIAPHAAVVLLVFLAYRRVARVDLGVQFSRRWRAGLVVGLVLGALLVRQVMAQPPSERPEGLWLLGALGWEGVVYGSADALLLSVLPVLSLYGARPAEELGSAARRLQWALVALAGSAVVAALYHLGFTEYRGPRLIQPVIGNVLITLSYLIAGNPLAPVTSHVLMHVAAVLHGMATTSQLPPHY